MSALQSLFSIIEGVPQTMRSFANAILLFVLGCVMTLVIDFCAGSNLYNGKRVTHGDRIDCTLVLAKADRG
jgi:hypothetical protein